MQRWFSRRNGAQRYEHGYTNPMLLVENAILEKIIAKVLEDHLLAIEISTLIGDRNRLTDEINCVVELSIRAFLAATLSASTSFKYKSSG